MTELPEDLRLMIEILAATDTIFVPFRRNHDNGKAATAVYERCEHFREKGGIDFTGGGSDADRQQHHRALQTAKKAKLISIAPSPRPRVRLTNDAETRLRHMVGAYRIDESWPTLKRIATLTDDGQTNAGCVPETNILRKDYDRLESADLVKLESICLPLLVRGYLESASDSEVAVGYAITDAGRDALNAKRPTVKNLPGYNEDAADFYSNRLNAGLADRESWVPSHPNLVLIPLSCGNWPEIPAKPSRAKRKTAG